MYDVPEPFLAPEQVLPADEAYACMASDRWQLGLILLQLLCCKPLDLLLLDSSVPRASRLTTAHVQALFDAHNTNAPMRDLVLGLLQPDPDARLTDAGMEEAVRNLLAAEIS